MKPEEYISAIEKFVGAIILPEFPEIKRFDVEIVGYFMYENKIPYIFVNFYKDPMVGSRLNKLEDEINRMKAYMSFTTDDVIVHYNLHSA